MLPPQPKKGTILWRKNTPAILEILNSPQDSAAWLQFPKRRIVLKVATGYLSEPFAPWHFVMLRNPWGPLYAELVKSLTRRRSLTCSSSHTDKKHPITTLYPLNCSSGSAHWTEYNHLTDQRHFKCTQTAFTRIQFGWLRALKKIPNFSLLQPISDSKH